MTTPPPRFVHGAIASALVLLALVLRVWNLQFGLPEWYHPDERLKAYAIARIARGDLHPGSFYHPSFMLYASALTLRLQHPNGDGIDEQSAARAGRLTVALLGSATVALTAVAGTRAFGTPIGLLAAFFLAIAPLHVVCSHYLKEDVALAFWGVATFLTTLGIIGAGTTGAAMRAALCAGAAAGTKYTGALFFVLPWLAQRQRKLGASRRLVVVAAAAFLVTTPFAVVDLIGFLRGAGHGGGNAITGMAGVSVWPFAYLWTYHLRFSLLPGFGLLPMLAAAVGAIVAIRRRGNAETLLMATVVALYLVFETSPYKPPPNADRQVVPLLPFLALLAALGVHALVERAHDWRLVAALALLIGSGSVVASIRLVVSMHGDTRQAAAQWLIANACGAKRIVLEGALNSGGTAVPSYVPELPSHCAATYVYSLERERAALGDADIAVASSFTYDRYLRLFPSSAPPRQFYESFFATHRLVAEFVPTYRSYGFNNPTIRIYASD